MSLAGPQEAKSSYSKALDSSSAISSASIDHILQKSDTMTQKMKICSAQKILLLGAKWFDTCNQYTFLLHTEELDVDVLEHSPEPEPTLSEWCCMTIAWPSTGGLVVAGSATMLGEHDKDSGYFIPADITRLKLCAIVDEEVGMLRGPFRGKTLANVVPYEGYGFLNSWAVKVTT